MDVLLDGGVCGVQEVEERGGEEGVCQELEEREEEGGEVRVGVQEGEGAGEEAGGGWCGLEGGRVGGGGVAAGRRAWRCAGDVAAALYRTRYSRRVLERRDGRARGGVPPCVAGGLSSPPL